MSDRPYEQFTNEVNIVFGQLSEDDGDFLYRVSGFCLRKMELLTKISDNFLTLEMVEV